MAATAIMLDGVLMPKDKMHAPMPVTFVGVAWNPDLSVGGGPIYPPQQPPGIWGPPGPWPTPPIAMPPVPPNPPDPPTEGKPPPPDGGWAWHPDWGWGYYPGGPGGKPQPPGK
jgi:hypothetical protein